MMTSALLPDRDELLVALEIVRAQVQLSSED